jgi:hypothetical protein
MSQYATDSPAAREPLLATLLPRHMILSLPGEATEEAVSVFLFDNLAIDNSEVLELTRRDSSGVQHLNVGVRPVLCLRLEEVEACNNEELSANEQEHDLSTPVELIRVDEVREDRRQHQSSELLADQGEGDGLWASSLRSSLLSNGPTVAANGTSVEHRPGDHEGEKGGIGSDIGSASHGGSSNDDRPEHEDRATANHTLAAWDDIGKEKGDEVGEKLEGRRDGGKGEWVFLANKFEVISLIRVSKVTTAEVLTLKTKNRNKRPCAVLLCEYGLPAGLAFAILLSLGLLELGPEDLNALFDISVGTKQLDDSLACVGLTTLFHEPDGRLGEKGHSNEE